MKSLIFAIQHLTRIPMPAVRFDEVSCGRSTIYFPAVGIIIGALLSASAWLTGLFLPVQVQAALLVILSVVLTGGIHLDGFMDSIDGLFSGQLREKKLEIMRDSRVGAFGVLGAICILLLKYSLFLVIPEANLLLALPAVMTLSRWNMTLAVVIFPYARLDGLGKIYSFHTGFRELIWATVIAAIAAAAFLGAHGAVLMFLGGAITYMIGRKITSELGGLTGDTYGFINEFLETALLLVAYTILTIIS